MWQQRHLSKNAGSRRKASCSFSFVGSDGFISFLTWKILMSNEHANHQETNSANNRSGPPTFSEKGVL